MDEKRLDLIGILNMLFNWGELGLAHKVHRRIGELYLDKGQVIFQKGDIPEQSGTYLLYMSDDYYTVATYDTDTYEFDDDDIDVDEIMKWVRLED